MAKKKKTQLKPVARGFATTSVPKKAQPVPEEPEGPAEDSTVDAKESTSDAVQDSTPDAQVPVANNDEFDPDKVEEQSLQNLVDRLQEKIEKDVVRTIKNLEVERRYAQTLPALNLDSEVVDRVLQLIVEGRDDSEAKKYLEEPEDKAVARLGVTYGVLRRLGFSEERVEECLNSIYGIDIDEAYEWLLLHCAEDEFLSDAGQPSSVDREAKQSRTVSTLQTPQTPRTPSSPRRPKSPSPPSRPLSRPSRLDAQAPIFIPSGQSQPPTPGFDQETERKQKDRILDSRTSSTPSEPDSPEDDPNLEYVRLKLKLDDLTGPQRSRVATHSDSFIRELRSRLEAVKRHYFFDEKDAEAHYKSERDRAVASSLQARLRNNEPASAPVHPPPPVMVPKHTVRDASTPVPSKSVDVFDSDGDDGPGGLFEILDAMPSVDVSNTGTTIRVRDMPLPKSGSARTPKTFLAEVVTKTDSFAVITYRLISGASRAKRAALTVRWGAGKASEWSMEDIACYDVAQAEQYIATVALHALTFPPSDGFASGKAVSGSGQTFFRLFPPAYRELWDELEVNRKTSEDSVNRAVWAKLRNIIEPKLSTEGRLIDKAPRLAVEPKVDGTRRALNVRDGDSEQLMSAFRARQSSAAYQEMLVQRNRLPISQYRDEIISSLETSQILVLSGETGCGKSTQLPAFILEDQLSRGNPCRIYCTEPRRISAISLAQRVSRELGDPPGAVGTTSSLVGYSIRLESNTSRNTRLAFVTNGIALRMLEGGTGQGGTGTAFDEITHIIIDEVHERSIESDFLLIVLKSLMLQRPDLKIILMSATVDADKISQYFGNCPVMRVPGRTFPVDVRFLEDAVELTQWTINEKSPYAKRLNDKFHRGKNRTEWSEDTAPADDDDDDDTASSIVKLEKRYSPNTAATLNLLDERIIPYDLILGLLERICLQDPVYASYSAAILIFLPGIGEIRRLHDILTEHPQFGSIHDFVIYPLHSTISSENQGAVFDVPPPGVRKIVIATNIAETGITIPDITCVIDSGKHREMRFDEKRQISRLVETFVARSNAAQRRGRSGRVQNGLCFHLFTKIRHDTQMAEHPDPEMMRLSLSDLALRIKIMKVNLGSSIEDVLSRALDPPSSINIQRAVSALVEVRALTVNEDITPLGRLLSTLPTDVHLGKFLVMATLFRCLDPALTIAATLNSKSPFLTPFGHEDEADRAKNSFRTDNSDFMTLHNAFSSWRRASANAGFVRKFCRTNFLSHQTLQQIEELRQQFLGYLIDSGFIRVDRGYVKDLSRARYSRNRTKFIAVPAELDSYSTNTTLLGAALAAGLYPKILSVNQSSGQLTTITNNQIVAFHPSSVNFRRKASEFGVNHLVYFTLMHSKKLYAWETGPADDVAMLLVCGDADFKLMSDSAFIDRKIKFHIPAKTNLALKYLRNQLAIVLASQLRGKPLVESQVVWMDLALGVLGKIKQDTDAKKQQSTIRTVVVHS
ncbi:P-loop containing nucleoside triphosphate hydrolase protein [Artomyces pyxidatus]|uniref:P-loop containing nucleoside triphosphate hydrolase protein n=1 Tax=Artomyces pyxidatus TaxID=48021 RepID=A0ACB8TIZ1_9AGAM|nr:P-loop containing nucleoside triphosphate hydrolase protein [Artomyces pyxidatus]